MCAGSACGGIASVLRRLFSQYPAVLKSLRNTEPTLYGVSLGNPCSYEHVEHNVANEVYKSYCQIPIRSFWTDHP